VILTMLALSIFEIIFIILVLVAWYKADQRIKELKAQRILQARRMRELEAELVKAKEPPF